MIDECIVIECLETSLAWMLKFRGYSLLDSDMADFLMVDTRYTDLREDLLDTRFFYLEGLNLRNATDSRILQITDMAVVFPDFDKMRLREIYIGGDLVWSGNKPSPFEFEFSPSFDILEKSSYDVSLTFSKKFRDELPTGQIVSMKFIMQDNLDLDSYEEIDVYPASDSGQFKFTVKSKGIIEGDLNKGEFLTTVEVEYNDAVSEIVRYEKYVE